MSKLVDKERLAKLAKALNDRMKAAVKAEEARALQAEGRIEGKADQNATAIAAINNVENGILAQAKGYTDSAATELDKRIQTKVSTTEYEAEITGLKNKDKEMAEDILGLDTAVKAIENKMGDGDLSLPAINTAIENFKKEQKEVDAAQDQKVAALEVALNGDAENDVPGLIAEVDALEQRLDVEGGIVDRIEAVEEFVDGHSHAEIEADIQGLDGRIDQLEAFKNSHDHKPMEDRIAVLEEMHSEGGDVDKKIEAVQGDIDALEQAYTKFIGEQAAKDQGQDLLIAAKADKATYEAKVEELEGKDAELNQAIVDEAARAAGVEQGLQQAIDAINDTEDGIFAKAKELIDAEKDAREDADEALDGRLQIIENSVGQGGALEARVKANEDKLDGLEEATVQASINKAEADAKAHAEAKIAELVDSAPEAMDTLNELAKAINDNKGIYDSYIEQHAQAMAKQKEDLQAEIDADVADAIAQEVIDRDAAIKVEADRAKEEEQAIRGEFAAADAQVLVDAKAYADQEVGKEKTRAEGQEAAIRQELADEVEQIGKDIAAAVLDEENRAKGVEDKIREDFEAADSALDERLQSVEDLLGGQGEGDALSFAEVVAKVEDLEDKDAELVAEDQRLAGEIAKKVDQGAYNTKVEALEDEDERIAGLVQQAQDEVDAVEGRMSTAEGKITTLEGFMNGHRHDVMEQGIADNKQGVADNKAAIEVLNGDATKEGSVAKSIADALKPYATEAETLAVIGNVIQSLALTMENNKMVLKLGGNDGLTINEVSLDMVTDSDIDEIINGLDDVNPTVFNF